MIGVPIECDNDIKRRNTHPMLLPKIKNERLTILKAELLKEMTMLTPEKRRPKAKKVPKRGIPHGVVMASQFHRELTRRRNEGVCWEMVNMTRV